MPKRNQNDPLLKRDQRRAIAALLVCPSVRKASERSKIDRHRIRRWIRSDKAFVAQLVSASESVFDAAKATMRASMSEAVEALRKLLRNKDPEIVLKAARELVAGGFDADVAIRGTHEGGGA